MKYCHPSKVRLIKTPKHFRYEVKIHFDVEMYKCIQAAAELFTDGCVCEMVGNCFMEEFKRLTLEVADAQSKRVPQKLEESCQ